MNNWISIKDRNPKSGKMVIVYGKNSYGKVRRLRAFYAAKFTIESFEDDDREYDEENDIFYVPVGWYECNECEDTNWHIDFPVTHWQPLPDPPEESI